MTSSCKCPSGIEMNRETFNSAISRLVQVPFVHHGRDPYVGLDCLGFVFWLYREVGVSLDHLDQPYGNRDMRRSSRERVIALKMEREFIRVHPLGPFQDGDLVMLGQPDSRIHLGVIIGDRLYQMKSTGLDWDLVIRQCPFFKAIFRKIQ